MRVTPFSDSEMGVTESSNTLNIVGAGQYTITATAGANGIIDPEGAVVVMAGDDQIFTITADSGYEVADVLVDGLSEGPVTSYEFTNVQANHTIEASFRLPGAEPTVENVELTSTSGSNLDSDDLTCGYDLVDATTAATAWYRDGTELMTLFLPMEGGESNALLDFSGNGVVVTTGDSPTWNSTAGHGGTGAFEFDGDDLLDAGAVFPTLSSYSQAAWVKTTTTSGYQNIISSSNRFEHLLLVHNGYLECGHNALESLHDPVQLTVGEWYHVAVTFDYDSGELILYKNGSPVDRMTITDKDMTHAGTFIGRYGGGIQLARCHRRRQGLRSCPVAGTNRCHV